MKFELKGVDDALRNLRKIDEAVTDKNLTEDALEVLKPVVEDARSLAPVAEGDLRDSIEATVLEDRTVAVIIRDWKGHFFEFGTVKMRATPMLIPAWEAHVGDMGNAFGILIGARIEYGFGRSRSRVAVQFEGL